MHIDLIPHGVWRSGALLWLIAAFAVACGAAVRNPALDHAHLVYQNARQDLVIVGHAGVALDKAAQTLEKADRSWEKDRDVTETEHLAYIAEKRVEIARAIAERRLALDELQQTRSIGP